ncbi:MAG TPA: hypothetical protein VN428_21420 [Bryobacteraceae bacterium]|nr:hypothetical protein [Bryobacteraceae bacterium]
MKILNQRQSSRDGSTRQRVTGARRRPPAIREASFEDWEKISNLQVRHGMAPRSRSEWQALWTENPAYQEWGHRTPIAWVLENEDHDIVGSISNIPFSYRFRRRLIHVVAACGWVVDPAYRGYSLLLHERLSRQQDVHLALTTTASAGAAAVFDNVFHWSKPPVGIWNRSAFWITDYPGFAAIALKARSIPFAPAAAYPAAAALFLRDKYRGLRDGAQAPPFGFELRTAFDSRFDDFWAELAAGKEHLLFAVRDRPTLEWHFRHFNDGQLGWILTAMDGSRMVAYAIVDRQDKPTIGLRRARIIDFQALTGYEGIIRPALAWMLRKCRMEGTHILENVGCWLEAPGLPPIPAPHHRTLPSWMFYYKSNDGALAEALTDATAWAPSSFDGDVSL